MSDKKYHAFDAPLKGTPLKGTLVIALYGNSEMSDKTRNESQKKHVKKRVQ